MPTAESTEERVSVPPERYRQVLGHLATGVTVITAYGRQQPLGMTVNSVTSLSLNPALILFCPAKSSSTWPRIRATGCCRINVMAGHHASIARQFSVTDPDRFQGALWTRQPAGPALDDAVAWIECTLRDEHDGGDHSIVVAEVVSLDAAPASTPLVFFRGRYGTFSSCPA
jgi:3-hydroxy-9,10-secoandrosta-1,3,5(10)-triene-9,17-dione monooxygenase reductase component